MALTELHSSYNKSSNNLCVHVGMVCFVVEFAAQGTCALAWGMWTFKYLLLTGSGYLQLYLSYLSLDFKLLVVQAICSSEELWSYWPLSSSHMMHHCSGYAWLKMNKLARAMPQGFSKALVWRQVRCFPTTIVRVRESHPIQGYYRLGVAAEQG